MLPADIGTGGVAMFSFFNTAASHGKRDGKLGYPIEAQCISWEVVDDDQGESADSSEAASRTRCFSLPPYEAEQVAIAEARISQLQQKWEEVRHKIEARLVVIENDLVHAVSELKSVMSEFRAIGMKRPHVLISTPIYLFLMLLLGVCEFPYNYEVFREQLSSGFSFTIGKDYEVNVEAIVLSIGIAVTLLVLAHFIGVKVRHWSPKWKWTNYVIALAGIVATFSVLQSLYHVRLHDVEEQAALNSKKNNRQVVSTSAPKPSAPQNLNSQDGAEELTLYMMLLNVGFIIVGVGLSYYSHSDDREGERISKHEREISRRIERLLRRRGPLAERHDREMKLTEKKAEEIRQTTLAILAEYRDWNMRTRAAEQQSSVYPNQSVGVQLFRKINLGSEMDVNDNRIADLIKSYHDAIENTDASVVSTAH